MAQDKKEKKAVAARQAAQQKSIEAGRGSHAFRLARDVQTSGRGPASALQRRMDRNDAAAAAAAKERQPSSNAIQSRTEEQVNIDANTGMVSIGSKQKLQDRNFSASMTSNAQSYGGSNGAPKAKRTSGMAPDYLN